MRTPTLSSSETKPYPRIFVSGFGPFQNYVENPSWKAVSKLKSSTTYELTIFELPVSYNAVRSIMSHIYEQGMFDIYVHVGVGSKGGMKLETVGHGNNYTKEDTLKELPTVQKDELLRTDFDVAEICETLSDEQQISVSSDAGHFVCDYTFYTSLSATRNKNSPVMFIHVPPEAENLTTEQVIPRLRCILVCLVDQFTRKSSRFK
ncbi:Pyroglutamyl-peptidase 1 [Neolecta irregularis DAH-3]|uniref:Pyroglutamyl-peptidase 1 n=1 Tax=Neolecta irregularis (strain DAH-3) TaxID=1198029 RepID=A0A1U7LVX6_NEOID|nr:Pyroglutamyl-peptidase 1 [Neolecta irregularis DAH-3]|eukprot:OLL26830.1 Pyroglutamyl-peptidase 1 [Neolecta irregularis DAH-3]